MITWFVLNKLSSGYYYKNFKNKI